MDILLLFDTEDVFSAPAIGNDDSILELASMMTDAGLPGVFLFIGDRAESLLQRQRRDVIAALAGHEVGLHTRSAQHPCNPEYVAGKSWDDGVAETLKREADGVEVINRVFAQRCCALSTHWMFASPQALRAAAILGLPYVYAYPAAPPRYNLSYYAGALCLPWWSPTLDEQPFPPYWDGFDETYHDDRAFAAYRDRFDAHIDGCIAAGHPFMSFLMYHPQRLRLAEFIDFYMTPNGCNRPPASWAAGPQPKRYSAAEVAANRRNFRALADWLRRDSRLNPITMAELLARYDRQPARVPIADVLAAAPDGQAIPHAPRFSPAELLVAMAETLIAYAESGELPASVPRREVMGPRQNLIMRPEQTAASPAQLVGLARQLRTEVAETGHLPAWFGAPLSRIGSNHLYAAFSDALRQISAGQEPGPVIYRPMARYPALALPLAQRFCEVAEGANIDPELNIDALHRHAKLQTWTLKPAVECLDSHQSAD